MFWNYLKSALRNLRKNKLFAVINIAGLALGLTIYVFGGLLAWAVGEVILINRADPDWTPPGTAGTATKVRLLVITVVLYGAVAAIHVWLGYWPFPS